MLALVIALLSSGGAGLQRNGIPLEDVAVERTILSPGLIEVRLRNDG